MKVEPMILALRGSNGNELWWQSLGLPCAEWRTLNVWAFPLQSAQPAFFDLAAHWWLIDGTLTSDVWGLWNDSKNQCFFREWFHPLGDLLDLRRLAWHPLLPSVSEWAEGRK